MNYTFIFVVLCVFFVFIYYIQTYYMHVFIYALLEKDM